MMVNRMMVNEIMVRVNEVLKKHNIKLSETVYLECRTAIKNAVAEWFTGIRFE